MALVVLFCTMVRVRDRVGAAGLSLSRKVAARLSECVAVVEVARLNVKNVASEKKRNSLKVSGDRLHSVKRPASAAVVLREELALKS